MKIGIFEYSVDEHGNWFWKADYNQLLKPPRKLTKKEHDLPAFKAVFDIEGEYKERFENMLVKSLKEIAKEISP